MKEYAPGMYYADEELSQTHCMGCGQPFTFFVDDECKRTCACRTCGLAHREGVPGTVEDAALAEMVNLNVLAGK